MKKKPLISENDLQRSCVTYFRTAFRRYDKRLFSIPNGAVMGARQTVLLKGQGMTIGVWDLFLSVPRKGKGGMFIEMKVGNNQLRTSQMEFQDANAMDYEWATCYTFEDFVKAINEYLG